MTRLAPFLLALALTGCNQVELDRATELGQAFYCRLYPSECLPVPLPPERPAADQPAPYSAAPAEPAPVPPPVVKAPVAPPVIAKPVRPRAKFKRIERKPRRLPDDHVVMVMFGQTVTCASVRGKSAAERAAFDKQFGFLVSKQNRERARACLR